MARKVTDRYIECKGCRASVPTERDAKDFGWIFSDSSWFCDACGYAAGKCDGIYDEDDEPIDDDYPDEWLDP